MTRYARAWIVLAGVALTTALVVRVSSSSEPQGPAAFATADLPLITEGVSRAITWENRDGAPGSGGKEQNGRKGSPCIPNIKPGTTQVLMNAEGPGVIRHIWITIAKRTPNQLRNLILRMYWDDETLPSVEVPLGDFFGTAHGHVARTTRGEPVHFVSAWFTETLGRGFNSYIPMPFASHARITVENGSGEDTGPFYFQIDYELVPKLPGNTGRLHVQFRQQNPTIMQQDYVIVDGVRGPGMYVGTVIGVRALSGYWWGEGEVKMYMDGDTRYPTICGTGTEDYFGGAWGLELYQAPYHGCTLMMQNLPGFSMKPLVSMYRWHVSDPVRFRKSLKVTIQQIGDNAGLYERSDDYCSTAYWYQYEPHNAFPPLPNREARVANLIEPANEKR